MKLLIISHTEHYKSETGEIVGWGPTITEINHLTEIFNEIYHCAPLYKYPAPKSSLAYLSEKIHFVPLKPFGGKTISQKLTVLITAPHNLKIIRETLKKVDVFQFRAPTGMGVYMIPWLMYFSGKKGWFKYAGNWMHPDPPTGYKIQKWFLVRNGNFPVTINGKWEGQPKHCITFENPCLTGNDLIEGEENFKNKDYSGKLDFIFVGRLDRAKGVHRILNAFSKIDSDRIGTINLVGDGEEKSKFEEQAKSINTGLFFMVFCQEKKFLNFIRNHIFFYFLRILRDFPKCLPKLQILDVFLLFPIYHACPIM